MREASATVSIAFNGLILRPKLAGVSGGGQILHKLVLDLQFQLFEAVYQVIVREWPRGFCVQFCFEFGMLCLQGAHMTFVHRVLLFAWTKLDPFWLMRLTVTIQI